MILGVCGKIAAGKTEVLKVLEEKGFYCIQADKIVHDLYKKGAAGAVKVAAVFGKKFLRKDGAVDRVKLRGEVFFDENKRKYLENIVHPEIYEEVRRLIVAHAGRNIAIEAVYFDEDFLGDFVDTMVWVERPREKILQVLIGERDFFQELAEKAYELIEKPYKVDVVLENSGNLGDLKGATLKFLSCVVLLR